MIKEINPKEFGTIKALEEVKDVFDRYKLTFWLDFGTLLGAVRDKKILPWETDLDLFLIKDKKKFPTIVSAFKELEKRGFEVCYFWERGMINLRKKDSLHICTHFLTIDGEEAYFFQTNALTSFGNVLTIFWWLLTASKYRSKRANLIINTLVILIRRHGKELQDSKIPCWLLKTVLKMIVAIFYLIPFKEKLLRLIWNISKRNCKQIKYTLPAKNYEKFKTMRFYGKIFKIPFNYQKHLAYMYGKDWKIPKANWGSSKECVSYKKRIAKVNMPKLKY